MEKLTKGDSIQHNEFRTQHIVDICETFDNITVVFTEDKKCFPIETIIKTTKSKLARFFLKKINTGILANEETKYIEDTIKKLKPVKIGDYHISNFLK
jgi:hypothetical protein